MYWEWDLDGDTHYQGMPYYVYCDSHVEDITLRLRWGAFGIGIAPKDRTVVQLGCDHLQIGWKLKTVGWCGINLCADIPIFRVNGHISVGVNAPIPSVEVLYKGEWWGVPTRLWLN